MPQLIEMTAKNLKRDLLRGCVSFCLAAFVALIGLVVLTRITSSPAWLVGYAIGCCLVLGVFLYRVARTRFQIWWNHG